MATTAGKRAAKAAPADETNINGKVCGGKRSLPRLTEDENGFEVLLLMITSYEWFLDLANL